jgi:uncharacterized membrane protein
MLPLVYLSFVWAHLPAQVPLHYNGDMQADRFGGANELMGVTGIMTFISIGLALLLNNLIRLDPKKRFAASNALLYKISWTVVFFLAALSILMIYEARSYNGDGAPSNPRIMFLLLAVLFTVLGNFLNNIKPNYFVGIRTPWALEDEENWRRTHHLGAKIWFFGGLIMLVLFLIVPVNYISTVMLVSLVPMVIIPVFYSYSIFRRQKNNLDNS